MSTTIAFYKFGKGAKRDLLALNSRYTFSAIIRIVKQARTDGNSSSTVTNDELVIRVKDRIILGVSLNHLSDDPRTQNFRCDICFDSHSIKVGDECEYCGGVGCKECDGGFIFNSIACPNCTSKNTLRRENDEWSDSLKHKRQQRHGNRRSVPRETTWAGRRKAGKRN